jgi:hypothetical protein
VRPAGGPLRGPRTTLPSRQSQRGRAQQRPGSRHDLADNNSVAYSKSVRRSVRLATKYYYLLLALQHTIGGI